MNKMIAVLMFLASVVVPNVSSAAFSCGFGSTVIGAVGECWNGLFMGTVPTTQGEWLMSDSAAVNDTASLTGTTNTYPDISGTLYGNNPALYAEMGSIVLDPSWLTLLNDPTQANIAAANANIAMMNVAGQPVPFPTPSDSLYADGLAQAIYTHAIQYSNPVGWSQINGIPFFTLAGNVDEWVVRPGASTIPVPPAGWLFGSGLMGLVGVARRKR